jgi:hypothetical protein
MRLPSACPLPTISATGAVIMSCCVARSPGRCCPRRLDRLFVFTGGNRRFCRNRPLLSVARSRVCVLRLQRATYLASGGTVQHRCLGLLPRLHRAAVLLTARIGSRWLPRASHDLAGPGSRRRIHLRRVRAAAGQRRRRALRRSPSWSGQTRRADRLGRRFPQRLRRRWPSQWLRRREGLRAGGQRALYGPIGPAHSVPLWLFVFSRVVRGADRPVTITES